MVVVFLATAYWPVALEDAYITAAYAHEWVQSGLLRWAVGDPLEGYSNFGWLLLQVPAAWLGWDLMVFAKAISLGCGALLIALASRVFPQDSRGDIALFALVFWTPVAYWSAMAMETMAFALMVSAGWVAVLAGPAGLGVLLLAASSLFRPEGLALFVLGWALAARRKRSALQVGLACAAVLLGYQGWRYWYFGDLVPAPVHLKVRPGAMGPIQLILELPAMIGLAGALVLLGTPARRDLPAVLFPGFLSALLLASLGNGDWMGVGRLLVPGVVATFLAWAALGQANTSWTHRGRWFLVLALIGGMLETPAHHLPAPRQVIPRLNQGLDTTFRGPVAYLIDHAPDDGLVWGADIGMLGHLPRMRVMDTRGLVTKDFLSRDEAVTSRLRVMLQSEVDVIQSAAFQPSWGEVPNAEGWDPPGLRHRLPEIPFQEQSAFFYSEGRAQAHFRFYRRSADDPPIEVRIDRWRTLAQRFPSHRWIQWQLELARATGEAPEIAEPKLSLPSGPLPGKWAEGLGFSIPAGSHRVSGPVPEGILHVTGPTELRYSACDAVFQVQDALALPNPCAGPITVHALDRDVHAYLSSQAST